MKIDTHALTNAILTYGTPILLAALLHKTATGKINLGAAALDVATQALDQRAARAG